MSRLIDANELEAKFRETKMIEIFPYWKELDFDTQCELMKFGKALKKMMQNAPTVDAVEVDEYKKLVERYHELRENFIDLVCSGIPNVAPYCLNRCEGCCDAYGWCMGSDKCKGFNPAEVILDCAKMDGDGNA